MKWHFDTNSHKSKVDQNNVGWHAQKWLLSIWSLDSKLDIPRMNTWNKVIFWMMVQIPET